MSLCRFSTTLLQHIDGVCLNVKFTKLGKNIFIRYNKDIIKISYSDVRMKMYPTSISNDTISRKIICIHNFANTKKSI